MILVARLCFFLLLLLHYYPYFTFAGNFPNPYHDFPVDNIPPYYYRCFDYNHNLAASHDSTFSTQKPKKFHLGIGRGNAIANVVIIVITLLNIVVYKLRQLQEENSVEKFDESSSPLQSEQLCRRFSLAEILSATHNFDESLVIGQGGFGKVYKGVIDSGTVAIKRLNSMSKQGANEFWTEITMLSKFRHSHLVSLIGYCDNYYESILVYEFMVRGTIADHLYKTGENGDKSPLSWDRRLKICIDAARGLDYLHTGTGIRHRVIHRDVKSTNILLDENWAAKISDFGMSKIGPANQSCTHVSTHVKGTFGYIDPEYFLTRRLTRKSDVYSFGVVLFEVMCGRPPVDLRLPEDQRGLTGWAQHCIKGGTIDQIIDPDLRGQILSNCLSAFVQIANLCLHSRPKKRPTMAEVVAWLEFALSLQERRDSSIVAEEFFNGGVYDSQERADSFAKRDFINADNGEHHEGESDGIIQLGDANGRQSPIKPSRLGVANGGNSLIKPAKKMTFRKVGLFFFHTPRAISENVRGMGKCWRKPKDDLPNTIKKSGQVHGDSKSSGDKKRNNNSGGINEFSKKDGGIVQLHPSLKNVTPSPVHKDAKTSKNKQSDNNNGGNSALPNKDGGVVSQMPPSGQIVTPNLRMFTLAELKIATSNFRRDVFLGEGGFTTVFKGWVNEKTYAPSKVGVGMAVAIKKYNPEGFQGYKEWQLEVEFLGRFSHPNLVKLLGYCWEDKSVLIVYEFMQNGSLDNHLFRKGAEPLTWVTRLKIALGTARGLVFLHTSAERQIIYRDFKASNILLDGEFNAKLSDFGLAKSGPVGDSTHVSTRVAGTFGYVAPEYVATGHLTVKSDIYGFGVVLLEILTGLRVLDVNRPSGQHNLVDWARPFLHNRRKLKRVMDSRLEHKYPPKGAFELAALTLKCLEYEPKKRPLMKEVLETLEKINAIHRDETEITPEPERQE